MNKSRGQIMEILPGYKGSKLVAIDTTVDEKRPKRLALKFWRKELMPDLNKLQEGDIIECDYETESRRWEGPKGVSYFSDNDVIAVRLLKRFENSEPPKQPQEKRYDRRPGDDDDIPFA